jgi:hypothetical protein
MAYRSSTPPEQGNGRRLDAEEAALGLLAAVVWRGEGLSSALDVPLARAVWIAACRNGVEGEAVAAFGHHLAAERSDVETRTAAFRRNLEASAARLRAAGLAPLLIKADPARPYVYSNFDVVLERRSWPTAFAALEGWLESTRQYRFEHEKLFLVPREGPALHLHASVSWYDVPSLSTRLARERAASVGDEPWSCPSRLDELKILAGHIGFQTLAPTLADLLRFRALRGEQEAARAEARLEGWEPVFRLVASRLEALAECLDAGETPWLPATLPARRSISAGLAHARALARSGQRRAAARAAALRVPLVLAKQR